MRASWPTLAKVVLAGAGIAALVACGLSPAEQQAADQQRCAGFGFTPGTDAFAHCMMSTTQQREAQRAADRRQQQINDAIAEQAQKDREAADARAAREQANTSSSTSAGDTTIPQITVPQITTPSDMVCTGSNGPNAGSMSCHSP